MANNISDKKTLKSSLRFGAMAISLSLVLSGCMSLTSDKAIHFSATGAVAALAACIADEEIALAAGAGVGIGVGLAKELYDDIPGGTGFSMEDMFANALGTGVGTFIGYSLCHPKPAPQKPDLIEDEVTNDILVEALKLE